MIKIAIARSGRVAGRFRDAEGFPLYAIIDGIVQPAGEIGTFTRPEAFFPLLRVHQVTHLLCTEMDEILAELLRHGGVIPVTGARGKIEQAAAEFFDGRNLVPKSVCPLAVCRDPDESQQN